MYLTHFTVRSGHEHSLHTYWPRPGRPGFSCLGGERRHRSCPADISSRSWTAPSSRSSSKPSPRITQSVNDFDRVEDQNTKGRMATVNIPSDRYRLADKMVSRVGYGAMQLAGAGAFGPPRDHDEAIAVLRAAMEAGVDHIDTAHYYGPAVVNELIREALSPYPDDLALVSKVGGR